MEIINKLGGDISRALTVQEYPIKKSIFRRGPFLLSFIQEISLNTDQMENRIFEKSQNAKKNAGR